MKTIQYNDGAYVTVPALVQAAGVSPTAIRAAIRRATLVATKDPIGGRVLITVESARAYLAARRRRAIR